MNNLKHIYIILVILFFVFTSCTDQSIENKIKLKKNPSRIITLAPALTEIVYELGLGDHIIGNTKFCNFPEKAKLNNKIGGFLDINIELILKLKPDLIICYPEHKDRLKFISAKIEILEVKHISIKDILDSINTIGIKVNKTEKSQILINHLKTKLYKESKLKNDKRVLLIADRDPQRLKSMYIIGNKGFLNEILELSGGKNSYKGDIPYPSISIESISSMNPDIIIEFSFINSAQKKKIY